MVNFYSEKVVRWDNGSLLMIDQTKLPMKLSYIRCRDYREVVQAIRQMAVRGAPAIGVAAAMGLALVAYHSKARDKDALLLELEIAEQVLKNARPTAVNLELAVQRMMYKARDALGTVEYVKNTLVNEALAMADEDVAVNICIGRYGSTLLEDGDVVLTHCKWLLASRMQEPSPLSHTERLWGLLELPRIKVNASR